MTIIEARESKAKPCLTCGYVLPHTFGLSVDSDEAPSESSFRVSIAYECPRCLQGYSCAHTITVEKVRPTSSRPFSRFRRR